MVGVPIIKLVFTFLRQAAKPVVSLVVQEAKEHPILNRTALRLGRMEHRLSSFATAFISKADKNVSHSDTTSTSASVDAMEAERNSKSTGEPSSADNDGQNKAEIEAQRQAIRRLKQRQEALSDRKLETSLYGFIRRSPVTSVANVASGIQTRTQNAIHNSALFRDEFLPDDSELVKRGCTLLVECSVFLFAIFIVWWEYTASVESAEKKEQVELSRREQVETRLQSLENECSGLRHQIRELIRQNEVLQQQQQQSIQQIARPRDGNNHEQRHPQSALEREIDELINDRKGRAKPWYGCLKLW